jgi:hypothetical protein
MNFPFLPQKLLFTPDELNAHSLKKYNLLFSNVNTSPLNESTYHRGRLPFSRPGLLRALIYKNIRRLPSLTKLYIELNEHFNISATCGFDPPNLSPLWKASPLSYTTPVIHISRISASISSNNTR